MRPVNSAANSYYVIIPTAQATGALSYGGFGAFKVKRIDCNLITATQCYLMFFSGTSVPANGTAPLFVEYDVQVGPFFSSWNFHPDALAASTAAGLVAVLSTTAGTLTAATTVSADITVWIDEYTFPLVGTSTAGDLISVVASLQVWTEASGATTKKWLQKLEVINNSAAVRYFVVYAVDSPATTSRVNTYYAVPANTKAEINFGNGFSPYQKDSNGTEHFGCTVYSALDALAGTAVGSSTQFIRATYATSSNV